MLFYVGFYCLLFGFVLFSFLLSRVRCPLSVVGGDISCVLLQQNYLQIHLSANPQWNAFRIELVGRQPQPQPQYQPLPLPQPQIAVPVKMPALRPPAHSLRAILQLAVGSATISKIFRRRQSVSHLVVGIAHSLTHTYIQIVLLSRLHVH